MVIAYTFATDFVPQNSKELMTHKKNYKTITKKRNTALTDLNITSVNAILTSSKAELKRYTKEKNRLITENRVLGYTSLKNFLVGTSNRLLSFVISLLFLFVITKHIKDTYLKKYYLLMSFVFVVTTGYWLSWSLLFFSTNPSRGFDFPKTWYYIAIYVLPSIIFFASYYLFNYHKTIEQKLKEGIKLLINHISIYTFSVIPEKKKKEVFIKNLETYEKLAKTVRK